MNPFRPTILPATTTADIKTQVATALAEGHSARLGRWLARPTEDGIEVCVGDDTPDVPMLERAILAVAVADAHATARAAAHWTTPAAGGHGAVREVCDLLLTAHGT